MLLPRILASLGLLLFSHLLTAQALPNYNLVALGSLNGNGSLAYGMNESGMVVGQSINASGQKEAVVWNNGSIQSLGFVGLARDVNNSGNVVGETGSANKTNPTGEAFSWINGVYSSLGTLGGTNSGAYAINDAGVITGASKTGTYYDGSPEGTPNDHVYFTHAFKYENGVMTDLGSVSSPDGYSRGHGINAAGEIVGRASLEEFWNSDKHMASWDVNGNITSNPTIFTYSTAQDINDSGLIVGNGYTDASLSMTAMVWNDGVLTLLPTLGGSDGRAMGTNNDGVIVGYSSTATEKKAMISYDGTTIVQLDTLVNDMLGWSSLTEAMEINELGQIVGTGIDENGQEQAFMLVAATVPVPAAAWLFGSALLGLVAAKRKS